jgi:hypothetical protein
MLDKKIIGDESVVKSIVDNDGQKISLKNFAASRTPISLGGDAVKESDTCYE